MKRDEVTRSQIAAYADLLASGSGVVPSGDVAWKLRQILADPMTHE